MMEQLGLNASFSVERFCTSLRDAVKEAVTLRVFRKFSVGDRVTFTATVTGQKGEHVNLVLDNVPADMQRSITIRSTVLAATQQ